MVRALWVVQKPMVYCTGKLTKENNTTSVLIFVLNSPLARDLQGFLVFLSTSLWVYYAGKPMENAVFFLNSPLCFSKRVRSFRIKAPDSVQLPSDIAIAFAINRKPGVRLQPPHNFRQLRFSVGSKRNSLYVYRPWLCFIGHKLYKKNNQFAQENWAFEPIPSKRLGNESSPVDLQRRDSSTCLAKNRPV